MLTHLCWRSDPRKITCPSTSIKRKDLIVDYRRQKREHARIVIDGDAVDRIKRLKFLGVHITDDLKWSHHTGTVVRKCNSASTTSCG